MVREAIFFYPLALIGSSFALSLAMLMNSSSVESTKLYIFALNLKNSIEVLLRYLMLAQINPIYAVFHKWC